MCGRLTLKTPPDQWGQLLLPLVGELSMPSDFEPRYNIAPTSQLWAIARISDTAPQLARFRWGLIPAWATQLSIGNSMINARQETLLEKKSFKGLVEKQRCLIVADGYFEWQQVAPAKKQAYWITPTEGPLLLLAGLWESNLKATGQSERSCTIITTSANTSMGHIHDRMPVILVGQAAQRWMKPDLSARQAYDLLGSVDDHYLKLQAVSNYVNNTRHEGIECIAPMVN